MSDQRTPLPQAWKPGQSGNPAGKKPDSRNKATQMVLSMMEGGAEEITRTVIDAAKGGDLTAARLVIERLAPPLRERPLSLALPDTAAVMGIGAAQQRYCRPWARVTYCRARERLSRPSWKPGARRWRRSNSNNASAHWRRGMGRNEMRMGRMETQTIMHGSVSFYRVIADDGETSRDCIRRHGHDPDDTGKNYIVRYFIDPESGPANRQRTGYGKDRREGGEAGSASARR